MLLAVIVGEIRNSLWKRDHGPTAEGAAGFHTTRWTIVMRAAHSQAQGGQSALAELCQLYWYPLYIFARRRGRSPDDAQDLTQGFFLHVVVHRAFTGVNRLKGKFRSFLLASFQNRLSDAGDRARRLKRGGDKEFVQLDAEDAEERYRLEPIEFFDTRKNLRCPVGNDGPGRSAQHLRQEYATAPPRKKRPAISLAKELDDTNTLALALTFGAYLAHYERDPAEVGRLTSDLIELCTRQSFAQISPRGSDLAARRSGTS
jgi:DNA-directed RNA polymerase specialized sigma24 family protein